MEVQVTMRLNLECLKDVLQYCIDNLDYNEDNDTWDTHFVCLSDMYESDKLNYDRKDIMRSVLKLEECRFIKLSSKSPENKPYLDSCSVEDVTIRGYEFAASIEEPTIWEKTKIITNKVGNHTLRFIEQVAHDAAVESAKEAVKIIMTQK